MTWEPSEMKAQIGNSLYFCGQTEASLEDKGWAVTVINWDSLAKPVETSL